MTNGSIVYDKKIVDYVFKKRRSPELSPKVQLQGKEHPVIERSRSKLFQACNSDLNTHDGALKRKRWYLTSFVRWHYIRCKIKMPTPTYLRGRTHTRLFQRPGGLKAWRIARVTFEYCIYLWYLWLLLNICKDTDLYSTGIIMVSIRCCQGSVNVFQTGVLISNAQEVVMDNINILWVNLETI